MPTPLRALIVEDSEDDTDLLLRELKRGGYDPVHVRVDTPEAVRAALSARTWDVVFSDFTMPKFNAFDALALLRQTGLDIPFIIVSGTIGEDRAVEAMRAGAHDYIMKGNTKRLVPAIARELKEAEVRRARRQADERIRFLAYYDPLTELPNRTQLLDRLGQIAAATADKRQPAALLVLDLKNFREINDTLGHHNGDGLLRQVAQRLQRLQRRSDLVAHLNGDEFALLLCSSDGDHARETAKSVLRAFDEPFNQGGFELSVGLHIGVALYPDDADNAHVLMQRANVALTLAERNDQPCFFYTADDDPYDPERLVLMSDLRHALNDSGLFLHFQLKVNIRSGKVAGVEALVRWAHPQHGPIPPDRFVALAEKSGLIRKLTLTVLEKAVAQAQHWHKAGHRLPVAVNLSMHDMRDGKLADRIAALLANYALPPELFEVEITETTAMQEPKKTLATLEALMHSGVSIYIDDFGTGYSSMSYLKKLPVNSIKIDRSFVKDMMHSSDSAMIVRTAIDLAHNLGLKVVAEGVEDAATLNGLAALGCDDAQGYFISRPVASEELIAWYKESPWGLGKK